MKVASVSIHNFRRFEDLEVSFLNETLQQVSDRFLVLGDNGTGKTTLLQAIALPLALATRQIETVADFDWLGFVPGRHARWGPPRIELVVLFDEEEVATTAELSSRWYDALPRDVRTRTRPVIAGLSRRVQLVLDGDRCYTERPEEYHQFQGRYFARRLLRTDPSVRPLFSKLPGVFWFDQFRNLASSVYPGEANGADERESAGRVTYEFGVARLRRYLNGWKLAQQSRDQLRRVDYLTQLEKLYTRVFPGRSFAGVEPMPDIDSPTAEEFYFLLDDGHRTYDLVEMSAGEQAVFPILYEFVRHQIAHSVVLIDEIDLNLHSPAAQALVRQLPKLGPDCQFIFTTHSEAVSSVIGPEDTVRLPGGALCL
jgi:predicted ATPase